MGGRTKSRYVFSFILSDSGDDNLYTIKSYLNLDVMVKRRINLAVIEKGCIPLAVME